MPPRRGRATRISETIAKRIQRQISRGRLSAGAKLPAEREMARLYKTSRVSVREAYRSLEELGLLHIRRGADGGAFIAKMDHGAVQRSLSLVLRLGRMSHSELTEARLVVEPPIARLAARRASPEDLAKLKQVIERQEGALARRGNYRPTNMLFHRTLAECAHNLPLATLMNSLADLMMEEIVEKVEVPRPVQEEVCHFHRLIYDAVQRHDEELAHDLMLQHVGQIQGGLGESLVRQLLPPEAALASEADATGAPRRRTRARPQQDGANTRRAPVRRVQPS
ncbi:MAG TPA: FCD domain-containing protein [Vicinamibacterales bacterium]|nr:FCD domain-containing protein [Vicinamibacterales bacterium]